MKGKWILYSGLVILTIGVLLKIILDASWPVAFVIAGLAMKVYYLVNKVNGKSYRPGTELLFLMIGLVIFFSGTYLSSNNIDFFIHPTALKVTGITLKVVFVILFMRKVKDA